MVKGKKLLELQDGEIVNEAASSRQRSSVSSRRRRSSTSWWRSHLSRNRQSATTVVMAVPTLSSRAGRRSCCQIRPRSQCR